ncbi:DNA photolyase family protein [Yinghuangia sp. ASG 101]|uniref:cryptochrome/photolyase family protein n=1 Tax=Yinghuangia sp. ASG 101 TaxID=2896848 RepID=UPI001E5E395D|nr:deoxyribodipyrimidine photo-lyase [Yinghuangia sp. ASG 101]UGQ15047.1 DNA photolyase family protein [Yinghuangia sp. ASG 101]
MTVSVVLFTSDLRLHDHPPLHAAVATADEVVPLFVRDRGIEAAGFAAPNRLAFLADCLADLDAGLRARGGRLVVREGDVVKEVCALAHQVGAGEVHVAAGVSAYARRREERLGEELASIGARLRVHDGVVTVVPPGAVVPAGRDHFAVFTPYFRRWSHERPREPLPAPRRLRVPDTAEPGRPVDRADVPGTSPGLARGGETEGRGRSAAWLRKDAEAYAERHDDLAGDATSRLSPHLHFGTLSALELTYRARESGASGAEAFVRQLCWRDFHHQVLAARPAASWTDYRPRGDRWRTGPDADAAIDAWKQGLTGFPVVDAALRQLAHEGWMHNRARLITASFLAKTLYIDWRVGARHFLDLLVDGDMADNQLNWQWVAGTGTDTRPNRVLNPIAQSRRHDPDGTYIRRWLPELAGVAGSAVHEPWKLPDGDRPAYPAPIVELSDATRRFRRARG